MLQLDVQYFIIEIGPRALFEWNNIFRYRDLHYKDQTIMGQCYLYNENSYSGNASVTYDAAAVRFYGLRFVKRDF